MIFLRVSGNKSILSQINFAISGTRYLKSHLPSIIFRFLLVTKSMNSEFSLNASQMQTFFVTSVLKILSIFLAILLSNLEIETYSAGVKSTAQVGGLIGGDKRKKLAKLSYCYTSSAISAKVYDSRALGELVDYSDAVNNSEFSYITETGVRISNVYYYGMPSEERVCALEQDGCDAQFFITRKNYPMLRYFLKYIAYICQINICAVSQHYEIENPDIEES